MAESILGNLAVKAFQAVGGGERKEDAIIDPTVARGPKPSQEVVAATPKNTIKKDLVQMSSEAYQKMKAKQEQNAFEMAQKLEKIKSQTVPKFPDTKISQGYTYKEPTYEDGYGGVFMDAQLIAPEDFKKITVPQQVFKTTPLAWEGAKLQVKKVVPSLKRMIGEFEIGGVTTSMSEEDEKIVSEATNLLDQYAKEEIKIQQQLKTPLMKWYYAIGSNVPSVGASIGLGLAGQPELAAVLMSALELPVYNEARNRGASKEDALGITMSTFTGTSVLEKVGLDFLLGKIPIKGKVARGFTGAVGEGGTETLQQVNQNVLMKIGADKTQDIFEGAFESFVVGSFLGGAGSVAVQAVQSINNKVKERAKDGLIDAGVAEPDAEVAATEFVDYANNVFEGLREDLSVYKPETFKESRLAGLSGLNDPSARPGIETPSRPVQKEPGALYRKLDEVETTLEVYEEATAPFSKEDLRGIKWLQGRLEKTTGDIETLRSKNPEKVNNILERVEEATGATGEQALDVIRNMPTFTDIRLTKKEIKKLQKRIFGTKTEQNLRARRDTERQVKSDLNEYAKMLPLRERGKMLAQLKNAKTPKDLNKSLLRIEKLLNDWQKRKGVADIKKLVKRTKPITQSGKPVGKLTPAIQRSMDLFREAMGISVKEASQKMQENLEKYIDEVPPPEVALQNKILSLRSELENAKPEEVDAIYRELVDLYEEGKMMNSLKKFNKETDVERAKAMAVDVITGGKGVSPQARSVGVKDEAGLVKNFLRDFQNSMIGWDDMMDVLSSKDKGSKAYESPLNNWADVLPQEMAEEKGKRINNEKISKMFREAYDLKTDRDVNRKMMDDAEIINLGVFENAFGDMIDFKLSRAQARKRWMELQDPTLSDTFYEGMGYTKEMVDAINSLLTAQDVVFAEAQLDFYRNYYEGVNNIYEEMYGVSLPYNENYSPIRRSEVDQGELSGFGEFLGEAFTRASIVKGSLKSRQSTLKTIDENSDVSVLQQHIAEMEHFKAWATKMREMNAVFGSSEVKNAIVENHGKGALAVTQNFLKDFTTGGAGTAQKIKWIDWVRGSFTRAVLAVKPAIAVKQLASFPAYMENMPVAQYTKYYAEFWKSPNKNRKFLQENSELMKARGQNMERDIQQAVRSDQHRAFKKHQSFLNMLMLNVQVGDQAAILVGGWPVYKYNYDQNIKAGMGKKEAQEKAIAKFEKTTKLAQQSAYLSDLSAFQRMGSIAKLFSMFKTSPNQYFRKELSAIRGALTGRMPLKQAAKTLAIYHFVLPMFFQFISDGFEWDWEEQKRAMITGSLNGMFIVGDGFDAIVRGALGLKVWEVETPIVSTKDDVIKAITSVDWNDITTEDLLDAADGLLSATGKATGIPTEQAITAVEGINKMRLGSYYEGLGILLGWSPYKMEKKFKQEEEDPFKVFDEVFKKDEDEFGVFDEIFNE